MLLCYVACVLIMLIYCNIEVVRLGVTSLTQDEAKGKMREKGEDVIGS